MIIKKHKNKNNYLLTEDGKYWIRDFTNKEAASFLDINNLFSEEEYLEIFKNEYLNKKNKYPVLEFNANHTIEKMIIVSDGYEFKEKHKLLSSLPSDVKIIAVNKALKKWELIGKECNPNEKKPILFFVVNNPYNECKNFIPSTNNYYPNCISSIKTNNNFLKEYSNRGNVFLYQSIGDKKFEPVEINSMIKIDDYRNPICASISISYKLKVKKLLLFCCDDSFKENKNGSIKLENGLYTYPQQIISKNIIDSNLYWIKNSGVEIGNCSSGPEFKNTIKIKEEKINEFFS